MHLFIVFHIFSTLTLEWIEVKRKLMVFSGILLLLVIVAGVLMFTGNNSFRERIPELPETTVLSPAMQAQLDEALTAAKRKPSAENLGRLGMVYHSGANYREAAQCYSLATERDKKEWIWQYYYGYLSTEMGNSDAVISSFSEVTKKDPRNYHAWYYLGEDYKNLRENDLAEEAYKKAAAYKGKPSVSGTAARTDHFSLSTYARFKLARLYFDTGRLESAEETLKKLIHDEYLFGSAYRLLGTIYLSQQQDSLGNLYTTRANDLIAFSSPVDTLADKVAAMSRSELYLLKKIDEAERSIHSDWALKLVRQGMEYLPGNRDMISKAIKIYLWKGLYDEATALTDRQMKMFSKDYIEIKNTGMLFYQKALYAQAAKYWEKALEMKPGEHIVQLYLVQSYTATGEKEKAGKLLDQMIGNNLNNPEALADVTGLLFDLGERGKAAKLLTRLRQQAPSNPKVLRMLGDAAQSEGRSSAAMAHYQQSLKGDPADVKTIQVYGDLLMEKEMWDAYIMHYRNALKQHPNSPELLGRLGEALISCPDAGLRNVEEGKQLTERAFTCFNSPVDVMVSSGSHLAYAYALLGEKQKAVETITKTIGIGRREKIAASSQEKLENFYRTLQNISN